MIRWRPNSFCPRCGRRPAIVYYQATVGWARTLEAEEAIEDVVCTRPGCSTGYVIAAVDLHYAEPLQDAPAKVLARARRAA